MTTGKSGVKRRFCSECGTLLNVDARFCHDCGSPIEGRPAGARAASGASSAPNAWRWGVPAVAVVALVLLMIFQFGSRSPSDDSAATVPLGARAAQAPDISSMSPEERADRLFNRVMRLSSEGKADSAAFFASMAMGAIATLTPLNAHRRYDMGLIALVSGDAPTARAQSDTILAQHPTHLLGLSLAARVADARGDVAASRAFRRRLLAAESAERARALPEYTDHDADIRAAVELARQR
ncbi:MAG: zinc ribbon domain-containing protein [Gemmatimonadaceae bacterium]